MTRWCVPILVCALVVSSACTRHADLKEAAKLTDVSTGWFDAGITEGGKNKLVPSVTLRIHNAGQLPLGSVQLNLLFKRGKETEAQTESFVRGVGPDGLAAGATTPPLVIRAPQGYTGTQPRLSMLANREFVDFRVEVFGKHGSSTWVKLGEYPITRQLLTR